MGDLVVFQPVKRTIRRLAKQEVEHMLEMYRISAGYQDPIAATDLDLTEMFYLGMADEPPWKRFE